MRSSRFRKTKGANYRAASIVGRRYTAIAIIRLHIRRARVYPILEILYNTRRVRASVCTSGRSAHVQRSPSRYRYVYYRQRHRPSSSPALLSHPPPPSPPPFPRALAMTYRTRLVARTRSTAKQLFPAFPRLRRYTLRRLITRSMINCPGCEPASRSRN